MLPLLALAACASKGVSYVDAAGQSYLGALDTIRDTLTAEIAGKVYRGPIRANQWGQAKATLTSAGSEPLYCDFQYHGLKVKGRCTNLAGAEYDMQSR
jgi:hypothetical protein